MYNKKLETPAVLLISFNRPEMVKKVFNEIRKARPKRLFLFSDGPRNSDEAKRVMKVREIISNVDWLCEIKKKFSKKNLGIRKGNIEAMNWFLDNVEEGVVFEEDSIPSQDFFRFSAEMLEKYRYDERIMQINGCNFQRGFKINDYSYYFSVYPYTYGWGFWKRSRKKFDDNMTKYPEIKKAGYISNFFRSWIERIYVKRILNEAYTNPTAIDGRWLFASIINNGLCITPNENLVKNIGFDKNSAHTGEIDSYLSVETKKLNFPLKHPPMVMRDCIADERYIKWLMLKKLRKYFLLRTGLHRIFKII